MVVPAREVRTPLLGVSLLLLALKSLIGNSHLQHTKAMSKQYRVSTFVHGLYVVQVSSHSMAFVGTVDRARGPL
jgi:hypothetical protein